MTGAFLNALGILLGSLVGLVSPGTIPFRTQLLIRNLLGAAVLFFGARLIWISVNGTFLSTLKQLGVALLALILGNVAGKLLRLQKLSNRLGRNAANVIAAAQKGPAQKVDGLNACIALFCASPFGIVGAVTDGLADYFPFLAIKAVMDALAMTGFMKLFRWTTAFSAFPVFLFLGLISFGCRFYARPFLEPRHLVDPINITAGFIAFAIAIMIFEVRKVELANYLPALVVAPLLGSFWH